jgi:hypothetical protein
MHFISNQKKKVHIFNFLRQQKLHIFQEPKVFPKFSQKFVFLINCRPANVFDAANGPLLTIKINSIDMTSVKFLLKIIKLHR